MNEKRKWLRAVQAADFALHETKLYLDTHPDDTAAMKAFARYEAEAKRTREEYESRFGPLTCMSGNGGAWEWTNDPWPWNYCAN